MSLYILGFYHRHLYFYHLAIVILYRYPLFTLKLCLLIPLLALFAQAQFCQAKEGFNFYTYHNKPPYLFSTQRSQEQAGGLYRAYVKYLNAQQQDFSIKLVFLPRLRLNRELTQGTLQGAVLGVNPVWFNDRDKTKYLWAGAFMADKDVLVVKRGLAFPYAAPRDLTERSLALPRGAYFFGVSELIAAGKITAFETSSELQNLEMVEFKRVDATIMSLLTAKYFLSHQFKSSLFEILKVPHDTYQRQVLFPKSQSRVFNKLVKIINQSFTDPVWLAELKKLSD